MMTTPVVRFLTSAPALTVLVVLILLGTAGPARADATPPQLSISISDGRTEAYSGDNLRYTVTVTNLGSKPVRDLAVSSTTPSATTHRTVDHRGKLRKGVAHWMVDLAGGQSVTRAFSVQVDDRLPSDQLRLAAVACAATSSKANPTVCASDSDQLPPGAVAAEQQRRLQSATTAQRPAWQLPAAIGLGATLAAGLVTTGVLGNRRKRPSLRG